MELEKYVENKTIYVRVKPNAPKTQVLGFDEAKKAVMIAVAAVPDKGKANKELVKFVSKLLGKKVEIISGTRSREKKLRIIR